MHKKLLVLAAIAATAAIVVPAASASSTWFDSELGQDARWALTATKFAGAGVVPKPVYVKCYTSDAAFDSAFAWRFRENPLGIYAYAIAKSKTVYMRPLDCENAKRFFSLSQGDGRLPNKHEVFSFSTLLHEALHIQGIRDENTTECLANDGIRWTALALGTTKSEANLLSRVAFGESAKRVGGKYFSVSGDCQRKLVGKDWTAFIT